MHRSDQRFAISVCTAVIAALFLLASPAVAQECSSLLPATGQTTSYAPGDDGDVLAGAPLSYTDHGDGTISDDNTHLMWEKKNKKGGIHDADTVYEWTDALSVFIPALNNRCQNDETIDCTVGGDAACSAVGGECGFAGYRDWRLPNAKELWTIIDYSRTGPAMSDAFNNNCVPGCTNCSCVATTDLNPATGSQPDVPQTATSNVACLRWPCGTGQVDLPSYWYAIFADGFTGHLPVSMYVRAVRGGCAAGELTATGETLSYAPGDAGDLQSGAPLAFTDLGNGAILDRNTGLLWDKKNADPASILYSQATYSWNDALNVFIPRLNNRCQNDETIDCTAGGDAACSAVGGKCGLAGLRDWRLPNIREYQSIGVFTDDVVPDAPNNVYGPGTGTNFSFWTSTTHAANTQNAWQIGFLRHSSAGGQIPKSQANLVRAVMPLPEPGPALGTAIGAALLLVAARARRSLRRC